MAAAFQHQQQQQQRWLKDLALPRADVQLLAAQNIHTARDLLVQTPIDLVERLNIPLSHAQRILQDAAKDVAPPFITALHLHSTLHQHSVKLLTGLPALDAALRIGLPPAAITELVGPASVGKSQFAYTLVLQVVLPPALGGLGCAALYLDTEQKISVERVREMVEARLASAPPDAIAAAAAASMDPTAAAAATAATSNSSLLPAGFSPAQEVLDTTLNRVLIVNVTTLEELNTWMSKLDVMVAQHDVKLIVLDSIAALLRTEFGGGEAAALAARGEALGQHASALKAVAEAARIPVVVTNQVTAKMTGPAVHSFQQPLPQALHQQQQPPGANNAQQQQQAGAGNTSNAISSSDGQVSAALGTKWAHAVNVRLILERRGDIRVVTIAKSPLSANTAVLYIVTAAGVQQAPDVDGQAAAEPVAPCSAVNMPITNAPPG